MPITVTGGGAGAGGRIGTPRERRSLLHMILNLGVITPSPETFGKDALYITDGQYDPPVFENYTHRHIGYNFGHSSTNVKYNGKLVEHGEQESGSINVNLITESRGSLKIHKITTFYLSDQVLPRVYGADYNEYFNVVDARIFFERLYYGIRNQQRYLEPYAYLNESSNTYETVQFSVESPNNGDNYYNGIHLGNYYYANPLRLSYFEKTGKRAMIRKKVIKRDANTGNILDEYELIEYVNISIPDWDETVVYASYFTHETGNRAHIYMSFPSDRIFDFSNYDVHVIFTTINPLNGKTVKLVVVAISTIKEMQLNNLEKFFVGCYVTFNSLSDYSPDSLYKTTQVIGVTESVDAGKSFSSTLNKEAYYQDLEQGWGLSHIDRNDYEFIFEVELFHRVYSGNHHYDIIGTTEFLVYDSTVRLVKIVTTSKNFAVLTSQRITVKIPIITETVYEGVSTFEITGYNDHYVYDSYSFYKSRVVGLRVNGGSTFDLFAKSDISGLSQGNEIARYYNKYIKEIIPYYEKTDKYPKGNKSMYASYYQNYNSYPSMAADDFHPITIKLLEHPYPPNT